MSATGRKVLRVALASAGGSLALAATVVLTASCAVATPSDGASARASTERSTTTTTITSAPAVPQAYGRVTSGPRSTLSADQAITTALTGMTHSLVASASVHPHNSPEGASSYGFHAVVRAPSVASGRDVMALWEAFLVQGAVAEYLSAGGDLGATISDSTIDVRLPDGTIMKDVAGGAGDVLAGQQFDAGGWSDAQILRHVGHVLSDAGLTLKSGHVLHPLGPAPVIIATEAAPGDIDEHELMSIVADVVGTPVDVDGIYLEIDLSDGQVATRQAYSYRTGAGLNWANPVAGIGIGAPHGGPAESLAGQHVSVATH